MATSKTRCKGRRRAGPVVSYPEIVERPIMDETMAELVMTTGSEYSWDNPACWKMAFTCGYPDGTADAKVTVRSVIAANRTRAVELLRRLMGGLGISTLFLHYAKGPLTPEEIARIRDLNEEVERIKKAEPWKDPAPNQKS